MDDLCFLLFTKIAAYAPAPAALTAPLVSGAFAALGVQLWLAGPPSTFGRSLAFPAPKALALYFSLIAPWAAFSVKTKPSAGKEPV